MEKIVFFIFQTLILLTAFGQNYATRISKTKCESYKLLVKHEISQSWCLPHQDSSECPPKRISFSCLHGYTGLIVGGENASLHEFPHLAAIGWKVRKSIAFLCGASLISERFVLTVAHCGLYKGKTPQVVRLGDLNLIATDDGANPVDYNVSKFIKHPQYNPRTKKNDIALIELKENVRVDSFIRPACLYQEENNPVEVIATGWGQTSLHSETSDMLQKVNFKTFTNENCQIEYEDEGKVIFPSQICAGALGKDTCRGDSGGPIQIIDPQVNCVFSIVGLTSFGNFFCGAETPGVYTKVSHYLDWIEKIVWNEKT